MDHMKSKAEVKEKKMVKAMKRRTAIQALHQKLSLSGEPAVLAN
jgi:hypothetical protein